MIGNIAHRGHALRIAVGIMMLVLLLAGEAWAATITVDDSGGAMYTRIQDAIDNATAGDTIMVYSGTYYENVNVTKQLTLKGVNTGSGKPVVNTSAWGPTILLSADNITLDGFALFNSMGDMILVKSDQNNIINNTMISGSQFGIYVNNSNQNNITNK